jgi:heme/copper-type cytochrome/quinol oxidase subunit 2
MNGMFMPDSFKATQGVPVKLTLQSLDGAHGITIPEFNFTLEVGKKETKTGEFTPDKAGTFPFFDTHDQKNKGTVVVK